MSTLVYIDIETLPGDNAPDLQELNAIDYIVSQGAHPKNLKDQTKIDLWYVNKQEQLSQKHVDDLLAQEAKQKEDHAKQALHSMKGTIFCVSLAIENGPVETFTGNESIILEEILTCLEGFKNNAYTSFCFVGHNVYFDLGFLFHKAIKLKSPLRHVLPRSKDRNLIIDTNKEWNLGQYGKYTKLADIAAFLGIEQKDEIDGSQVWDAYKRGNLDQIIQHCESDVEVVREIYKLIK